MAKAKPTHLSSYLARPPRAVQCYISGLATLLAMADLSSPASRPDRCSSPELAPCLGTLRQPPCQSPPETTARPGRSAFGAGWSAPAKVQSSETPALADIPAAEDSA